MQSTPDAKFDHYKENRGKIERSPVIYYMCGRQKYRVDHADHRMPSTRHTIPHLHEYRYGRGYEKGKEVK